MTTPLTQRTLESGLARIAQRDAEVAQALAAVGPPELRRRDPGFATLLRAIVGQQVSIASAAAIWRRLEDAAGPVTPGSVLALDDAAFRRIGFSRQKRGYGRGLAADVVSGRLDLDGLAEMDDEGAAAELVKVKGIGPWSAEIYMLFALGRRDSWPADDLALMTAMQRIKGLEARPGRARMTALAEPWRPWRGAGAHLLWHYYRNGPM